MEEDLRKKHEEHIRKVHEEELAKERAEKEKIRHELEKLQEQLYGMCFAPSIADRSSR